jgi:hypothetical protein
MRLCSIRFAAAAVSVFGLAGCGTTGTSPSSTAPATDGGSDDATAASSADTSGAVSFPYTPYKCGYAIRQVSPAAPSAVFHDDTKIGAAPAPTNLHLTIAGDASSSVVIQWKTDDTTLGSEARFGDAPAALSETAHGFSFSYASGVREHEVHLCGLLPAHTYYYDAGGAGGRSKPYAFTTAPAGADDVKVLVGGDSRTDPATWGTIASTAIGAGATAMILTGDAVAVGSDQSLWDALFAASPDFFASVPIYWAHGNHEGLAEPYFAQLALPDNGGTAGIEQWYASTYGALRIIVLNDTVSNSSQITGPEATFLSATLANVDRKRTPWVVTAHHQPMYTTSNTHPSDTFLRGAWGPLYDQFHVNMNLTGHVHSYESTKPLAGGTATSEGAVATDSKGTRHIAFGGAGAPLYGFDPTTSWVQTRESTHGYAILHATATTLEWSAFRSDGTAIESFSIAP